MVAAVGAHDRDRRAGLFVGDPLPVGGPDRELPAASAGCAVKVENARTAESAAVAATWATLLLLLCC